MRSFFGTTKKNSYFLLLPPPSRARATANRSPLSHSLSRSPSLPPPSRENAVVERPLCPARRDGAPFSLFSFFFRSRARSVARSFSHSFSLLAALFLSPAAAAGRLGARGPDGCALCPRLRLGSWCGICLRREEREKEGKVGKRKRKRQKNGGPATEVIVSLFLPRFDDTAINRKNKTRFFLPRLLSPSLSFLAFRPRELRTRAFSCL